MHESQLQTSHAIGPDHPPVREITIGQALEEAAAQRPDGIALIKGCEDPAARREWTYAELLAESQTAAKALLSQFDPGDRIAVWAPNIPEWVILEYACALAGMILVTVNPSFQPEELRYVLQNSKSTALFTMNEFRGNRMMKHAQSVESECEHLQQVFPFEHWDEFLNTGRESQAELPDVLPGDAVMIQYTSGTTGFPKGALLHHRGLYNNGAHTLDRMAAPMYGPFMGIAPLFHTAGSAVSVLGALSRQSPLVLVEQFLPGLVLELFETYRGSAMVGVPTMLIAMMEHPDFERRDLSAVQAVCSGGSTVPAHLVQKLEDVLQAPFTIVFGQTECSPVASMTRADDTVDDKANTLGGPMPGVEVKIINPETGETLPCGEIGEYCTRGYHVMKSYFEMPEKTAEAIDAEGWLHTGDLCAMDSRGYCTVEGRIKDMIIRGGENLYPREIEEMLFKHDSVAEVAVVGLPDDRMGEEAGAFLRAAPGASIDQQELFAYLREHLSPQKTPRFWYVVDEFPLTGSGKIQKFVLRQKWIDGEFG